MHGNIACNRIYFLMKAKQYDFQINQLETMTSGSGLHIF